MSQENCTEWIISGNPKEYRVIEAFRELRKLDWRQSKKANIKVGDIVYVFVSEGIWAIRFKCRVNKTNIEVPDIDDHEYVLKERSGGSADRYMELEYYGAAEPPGRCGESHLSGLTEPLRSL